MSEKNQIEMRTNHSIAIVEYFANFNSVIKSKVNITKTFKIYVGKMHSIYVAVASLDENYGIIITKGRNLDDVKHTIMVIKKHKFASISRDIYVKYYKELQNIEEYKEKCGVRK